MVKDTSAKKLIRESWIGQAERYEMAGAAAKRLEDELALVPERIQKPLTERMAQVHENDKLISRQRTRIKSQVKGLQRNVKSWDNLANTALSRVKHTGDVQNWAEMIDSDLRVLERTVALKNSSS